MTPEQASELRKPFPKSAIGKLPRGGTQLDYVGHAAVTDRLLAVDPEWSWEPFALDEHGLPALDRAGNLWIKLTIGGTTRIGVGDGKNAKEVIGDALRNAAMRFGVALDLWSKEELEQGHLPEPAAINPPPADRPTTRTAGGITDAQLRALHGSLKEQGITERDVALTTISTLLGVAVESTKDLTRQQASTVIDALKQNAPTDEPPPIKGWEQ